MLARRTKLNGADDRQFYSTGPALAAFSTCYPILTFLLPPEVLLFTQRALCCTRKL